MTTKTTLIRIALVPIVLAVTACAPGVPTTASTLAGTLTTRTVDVSVSGVAVTGATATPGPTGGGIALVYDSSSGVVSADGSVGFVPATGPAGVLTLDLAVTPLGMSGRVTVTGGGLDATAEGPLATFTADDHGDVSGRIDSAGTSIFFATHSEALAPGTDPSLEALLAAETDFCRDAQQRLAGLDPTQVPLASIIDTRESPRQAFAASKAVLTPLTTRTWTDTVDIDRGGELRTISRHVSCKTRAADHVATTGVSVAPTDAECSVLNQRSINLALAEMTPGEIGEATPPALGPDVVRQTGAEWTTPLSAAVEFDGTTLRAHALLTRWTDPAFALAPETIRGVHYCTVWAPAYAYAVLTGSTTPGGAP